MVDQEQRSVEPAVPHLETSGKGVSDVSLLFLGLSQAKNTREHPWGAATPLDRPGTVAVPKAGRQTPGIKHSHEAEFI